MSVFDVVLAAHRSFAEPRTLLVDGLAAPFAGEKGAACLSQIGLAPEEMWACRGAGRMTLVVLLAHRSAREMFRVLSLAERLVAPAGKILILPVTDSASEEVRPEATEIFCGVHPEWSRRQIEGNVVELRRANKLFKKKYEEAVAVGRDPHTIGPMNFETLIPPQVFPAAQDAVSKMTVQSEWLPAMYGKSSGKRVVSLSVFGEPGADGGYWRHLPTYIRAHHALFPSYELRIHHDDAIFHAPYGDVLFRLQRRGLVRLIHVPSRPGRGKCESMLHRLLPAWDPEVADVFCRDVDALPTWRERCAAEEFVASGHAHGTIHDNREHGGMMGGLSHFRAQWWRQEFSTFDDFIKWARRSDEQWAEHGMDQLVLGEVPMDVGKCGVLEHSLRSRGTQTIVGSDFRTTIAEPSKDVVESVLAIVRERSDSFINYMGAAGRHEEEARAFYDEHCPVIATIREAEKGSL